MNTKVIYTCLTGNYDTLLQPEVVDNSFDFICFSNDFNETKIGIWEIRKIPFETNDNSRLSRYPKILSHKVLQDLYRCQYSNCGTRDIQHCQPKNQRRSIDSASAASI